MWLETIPLSRRGLDFGESLQQQEPPANKAQHIIQAEEKETVPHGRLGSRADGHLHLHHPIEYGQAVTRRRVPQGFDLRDVRRGKQRLGQEHS